MTIVNHKAYVSLEVAKLLKEAGFDWELNSRWQDWGGKNSHEFILKTDLFYTDRPAEYDGFHALPAPTLDVAQRWLREIRHRSIEVKSFVDGTVDNRGKWWIWHVYDFNPPIDWVLLMSSDCRYSTYEEAQEAGIKKALEMILEKEEEE